MLLQVLQGVVLYIILLLGIISSLGLVGTNLSRYQFIRRECSQKTVFSLLFENGMYVAIDFLRAISFGIFTWDAWWYFKEPGSISWHKLILAWLVIIVVAALFAVPTAVVSQLRDVGYVNACDSAEDWRYSITNSHATAKAFVLFSTLVVSFCAVSILYSAVCKWKESALKIVVKEWNGQNLSNTVYDKFFELYNNYIEVERSSDLENKALRRWFVLMYFIYLIYILVRIVHILLAPTGEKIEHLDLIHSILNISIYILGLFFPYYTAIWLNMEGQSYQRKMIDAYIEIEVKMEVEREQDQSTTTIIVTYLCKLGNEIEYKGCEFKIPSIVSSYERAHIMLSSRPAEISPEENERCREQVKVMYKQYCREALVIQGTNITNMTKAGFYFLPSFLNISIPLDSPGYAFIKLLTVISFIFSFVR